MDPSRPGQEYQQYGNPYSGNPYGPPPSQRNPSPNPYGARPLPPQSPPMHQHDGLQWPTAPVRPPYSASGPTGSTYSLTDGSEATHEGEKYGALPREEEDEVTPLRDAWAPGGPGYGCVYHPLSPFPSLGLRVRPLPCTDLTKGRQHVHPIITNKMCRFVCRYPPNGTPGAYGRMGGTGLSRRETNAEVRRQIQIRAGETPGFQMLMALPTGLASSSTYTIGSSPNQEGQPRPSRKLHP